MRRRGFTIIELIFVLSILGILSTLAVPRLRLAVERGEAAALHERVYSVRLAYEAAGTPRPELLRLASGVVPPQLAGTLNPDHFRGEGGVELRIVGQGASAYLHMSGRSQRSQRVRDAFHRLARIAHVHTPEVTLVPLSSRAIAQVTAAHGGTTGTIPATLQPPVAQPPVAQPPVAQPPVAQPPVTQPPVTQPPVTQPPVTQPPVTQPPVVQPSVVQPAVTQPQQPATSGAPVCAANLSPGQYRSCMSGTTHGNSGNGGGAGGHNAHAGGWFRQ